MLCALVLNRHCVSTTNPNIETVNQLYDTILKGDNPRVGFLSQANYDSVHTILPANTHPVIVLSTTAMVELVENGTLIAGLVSGVPPNDDGKLHTFSSALISPRAMFLSSNRTHSLHTMEALDAALVRVQESGQDHKIARENHPFEFVSLHTCKTTAPTIFAFPSIQNASGGLANALVSRRFVMSALGPYDWGIDGNYTATPPTGFWVDYVSAIEAELQKEYGQDVRIERQWHSSSDGVLGAVLRGDADFSEPYYTVDAFYNNRPRKSDFAMSCTTLGYDSTFFTSRYTPQYSSTTHSEAWLWLMISGMVVSVAVIISLLGVVLFMMKRERTGNPVFQPLQQNEQPARDNNPSTGGGDTRHTVHVGLPREVDL